MELGVIEKKKMDLMSRLDHVKILPVLYFISNVEKPGEISVKKKRIKKIDKGPTL
jgi:hypothetical protein